MSCQALQKYKLVEQHFLDYEAYQFDFHHYCLRKMTLRSYLSVRVAGWCFASAVAAVSHNCTMVCGVM